MFCHALSFIFITEKNVYYCFNFIFFLHQLIFCEIKAVILHSVVDMLHMLFGLKSAFDTEQEDATKALNYTVK
jgi:hypothetical protein